MAIAPAQLPVWRAVPVDDCERVLATWPPGGCEGEQIVWLSAIH
jgi:hypothetical protein